MPDLEKPVWWKDAASKIMNVATWYCVAVGVPGFDREGLEEPLDPSSPAGKAVTKEALNAEAADWLAEWENEVDAIARHAVTLGRRCAGKGWPKEKKSKNNKLANCFVKELHLLNKLGDGLESRSD